MRVVTLLFVSIGILLPPVSSAWAETACCVESATIESSTKTLDFTLKNLFDQKELYGKTAQSMAWSDDGRYLAFRWNVHDVTGYDVWVYDAEEKQCKRLTSPETFAPFDKEAGEIVRAAKKSDEKKESDGQPPEYKGVDSFVWSKTAPEMLLRYKNDVYRMTVNDATPTRLTKTSDAESDFEFTRDGGGFIYRRGSSLYRVQFGESFVEEIMPQLPDGRTVERKILSPDQSWMAVVATREQGEKPETRKVPYVTFRERFAKLKEHDRPLAEDPEPPGKETWVYLQKLGGPIDSGTDAEAVEVYHHEGGADRHYDLSNPEWSKDGSRIVFRVYDRDTEDIFIYTAKVDSEDKAQLIQHSRNSGGARSPFRVDPVFTPDGQSVVASFDDSGFRQPWLINPLTRGKVPVMRGEFDADFISFSDDGETMFVLANREHPAQKDLYAVRYKTGEITRLTHLDGVHSNPAISKDGKRYAAIFTSWDQPQELAAGCVDCEKESILTRSHPGGIRQLNLLKPQLFSYKNQHGQTIYGMLFLPPDFDPADRRPLMIYVYGGPLNASSMVNYGGFGTYNYRFPMYMARRHGYIAAVIDPRGSSNYGEAFETANWEHPGKPQVEDLSDGVQYLVKTYGADPNRVALYGWSFGGFVTQMAMYTKPDVFQVGMAGAGPTEWENYYGSYTELTISGSRVNQPDQKKFSLLPLAKNLKGRLMLVHGIEDDNVLFQDTVKVYQELMKAKKGEHVELVLDTTGGHHLGGDVEYTYIFWLFEDFLLRTLGHGNIDLAGSKPASASSNLDASGASLANDGNPFSVWSPAVEDATPWWQVDLGESYELSGADVIWDLDPAPVKYILKGSLYGESWDVLADRSDNTDDTPNQRLYFDAANVRYLRVDIQERPKDGSPAIKEFHAFQKRHPGAPGANGGE
ncbi:MAG: prolyl oligopeptidase family serine peptidase [bacterium]|nr:prolyl oligopeptidase family serine peptidase [bacterium]